MSGLVAVHLYGPLADQFGALHHFAVSSPREAISALDANYPDFRREFLKFDRYEVFADGEWREGEVGAILGCGREVHFAPKIEGQASLMVGALTTAFGMSVAAATIVSGLLITGLMLGISFLFRPKMPEKETEKKDESYVFSGPENTTGQGNAIPVIYGRVHCGSVVASAGQSVQDISPAPPTKTTTPPVTPADNEPPPYHPGHDGTPEPTDPPTHWGHDAVMLMSAPLEPGTPAFNMKWDGRGVEHLSDPLPEGWPAIVPDPEYLWKPEGWVLASTTWSIGFLEDDERSLVYVWQPDYLTNADYYYYWNMVRGFYVSYRGIPPENPEWQDSHYFEALPPVDPAP